MSTTLNGSYVCSNSTLANFKGWAQAISNAFSTFGWLQTSDTGQVNWSSVAVVPNSAYVYEIWQAADAQASTTPIFVKMEYGYSTSNPSLRLTVGGGSDGAGNITGGVMGPFNLMGSDTNLSNQSSTAYACWFSGNAGEFRAILWQSSATACCVFGIERSKDTSGNNTTQYVTALDAYAYIPYNWFQQFLVGNTITPRESGPLTVLSSSGTQSFAGVQVASPVYPLIGQLGNPMLGFYCVPSGDVAEGAVVTVNAYGANHTYAATKQGNLGTYLGKTYRNTGGAMLMRYE